MDLLVLHEDLEAQDPVKRKRRPYAAFKEAAR